MEWVKNNALFIPTLLIAWVLGNFVLNFLDVTCSSIVASLAVMRTARDYRRSWSFYFPPRD